MYRFSIGTPVRVYGLHKHAEYNGLVSVVVARQFMSVEGNIIEAYALKDCKMLIKVQNLCWHDPASSWDEMKNIWLPEELCNGR